jgi:hypothetical protein
MTNTNTSLEDAMNLGRALAFSFLAPLQVLYSLWIGKIQTPYLFIVMLFIGYTFAVIASYLHRAMVIFSLYVMALFFIVVLFIAKIWYK